MIVIGVYANSALVTRQNGLVYLFVLGVVICAGETVRSKRATLGFLNRIYARIENTASGLRHNLSFAWLLHAVFCVVVVLFLYAAGNQLVEGFSYPLLPLTSSISDLVVTVLTLTAGIASIFFAGSSFVIQLIIGTYSHRFSAVFFRSPIVFFSFILLIAIAITNFVFMWLGTNEFVERVIFYSGIFVVIDLAIVTLFIMSSFSSFPAIIEQTGVRVRAVLRKKFRNPRSLFLEKLELLERFIRPISFYRTKMRSSILKEVSDFLKEEVLHFVSAASRAIREDRQEVLNQCLQQLALIVQDFYYHRRKESPDSKDFFTTFLCLQIETLFELAMSSGNHQHAASIVRMSVNCGQHSLALMEGHLEKTENSVATAWTNLLARQAIRSLKLQRTSAPLIACEAIGYLSAELIYQGAFKSGIYSALVDLGEIGRSSVLKVGTWRPSVVASVFEGYMFAMLAFINNSKLEYDDYRFVVRTLLNDLQEDINQVFSKKYGFGDYLVAFTPFVEKSQPNVGGLFSALLRRAKNVADPRLEFYLLDDAKGIVEFLHRFILEWPTTLRGPYVDFARIQAEMVWDAISFLRSQSTGQYSQAVLDVIERLSLATIDFLQKSVLSRNLVDSEVLDSLSAIPALLVYFSSVEAVDGIAVVRDKLATEWVQQANALKQAPIEEKRLEIYYKYFKLFGAWIFTQERSNPGLTAMFDVLSNVNHILERDASYLIEFERMGFPRSRLEDRWSIFSSQKWQAKQKVVSDSLHSISAFREFNTLIAAHSRGRNL